MRLDGPLYIPEITGVPETPATNHFALYVRDNYLRSLDDQGVEHDVGGNQPIYQEVATPAIRDGLDWVAADAGKMVLVTSNGVLYTFDGTLPASGGFPLDMAFGDLTGTTTQRDDLTTGDLETGQKWTNTTTNTVEVWEGSWVVYGGGGSSGWKQYFSNATEQTVTSGSLVEVTAYQFSFTPGTATDYLITVSGEVRRDNTGGAGILEMRLGTGDTFQAWNTRTNNTNNYPTFRGQARRNLAASAQTVRLYASRSGSGDLLVRNYSVSVEEFPES